MSKRRSDFKKKPSKSREPRGLTIIHEDRDILVVNKSHGILTASSDREMDKTAFNIMTNYVKKGNHRSKDRIYVIHRLDRDVSGLLIFAKNEKAKVYLQDDWSMYSKTYRAIVHGEFEEKEGEIESFLAENKAHRMYSTDDEKIGKYAKTTFEVLRESKGLSSVKIELHTDRKNQIRVHFAEIDHPIVGDKKYSKENIGVKRLTLHASKLKIFHPHTKKEMIFEAPVPHFFKLLMKSKD